MRVPRSPQLRQVTDSALQAVTRLRCWRCWTRWTCSATRRESTWSQPQTGALRLCEGVRCGALELTVCAHHSGSAAKAHAFEAAAASRRGFSLPACSRYEVRDIRRSREVGQSYVSSCWTTLRACVDALFLLAAQRPQLLLCNGPGTCLPLVACACALRAVGSPFACGVVFVESVARVRRLSLTGQLLYRARMADAFFVQWEALAKQLPRARCLGRLL